MFCTNCGKKLPEDAAFCDNCGTAASTGTSASSTPGTAGVTTGGAATADALNWKIVGPVLAVAIIAVALVIGFALVGNTPGKKTPPGQAQTVVEAITPSITVDGTEVFALARPTLTAFADDEGPLTSAELTASTPDYTIDSDLGNVLYVNDFFGSQAQSEQRQLLAENGFVVSGSGGDEFFERYERNRYNKLPNFVTTDSMMHTYHLFFSHLLKNTERTYLSESLTDMSKTMLEASALQLEQLKGTEWEDAAKRNVAFFSVGAALLDSGTQIPADVKSVADEELTLLQAASGAQESPLLGHDVDYTQYIVRGYYEGDEVLEPYFRAMMWYGQASFLQSDEDLDRSALLMTIALDDGALEQWEKIYSTTSFFAGASDDCGYYEYKPLFTAAYGNDADVSSLAGDGKAWEKYHKMTEQMPAPRINSVAENSEDGNDGSGNEEDKGYRFMGQRFTIDADIFQHLIADDVKANSKGQERLLPNALDVPAAFGSDEALDILDDEGETDYSGYSENMNELRSEIANAPASQWTSSLYSRWLYTLNPLLEEKGEGWPTFMQSKEWTRKNLQSYLGSYTELKHDTVLYAKQAMAEAGGMIDRTDDRGYVEPEPELYKRLASMAKATADGLSSFGMLTADDAENMTLLQELSTQLQAISEKELRGEGLTDDEYELIRSYGVQLEHFWEEAHKDDGGPEHITHWDFPAAIVTDVASGDGNVLELGTGRPSVIYAIVPVDGELRVASGTAFSFYQFDWPASDRLTDSEWRSMMGFVTPTQPQKASSPGIEPEEWTQSFTAE